MHAKIRLSWGLSLLASAALLLAANASRGAENASHSGEKT